MKKTLTVLLCAVMALCLLLCGCGKTNEPATDPAADSDAVFDPALYDDDVAQLALLGSDSFYFVGKMTNEDGESNPMEMAVKGDATFMGSEMDGVSVGFMLIGEKYYMVYPAGECVLEIDETVSSTMGIDPADLKVDTSTLAFGVITEDMLINEEEALVDSVSATCRTYQQDDGEIVRTYLSEGLLIRLQKEDVNGNITTVLDIDTLTNVVPADKTSLPAGWKLYTGSVGMMSFMMKVASAVGFDNLE